MEEIVIIHTNDLHSHLEQWPRMRRYLNSRKIELEAEGKTVITVDLGDYSDRVHPLTEATDGRANTSLMNQVTYDAATIGNNEGVGNSKEQLNHLYDQADFDILLANLEEPETGELPSWAEAFKIIVSKAGTRIGLIGLTAPFPLTYNPNGWAIYETDQILPKLLASLVGKVEIIVLMSHLGIEEETRIAKTYPDINIILGSHTHHLFTDGLLVGETLLAAAGKYGRYIGEVHLKIAKHHLRHVTASVKDVSLLPILPEDQVEIEGYRTRGHHLLAEQVVGLVPRRYHHQLRQTNRLIDLALTAVKEFSGADVALLNNGLFLEDIGPGKVTKDDLHRCLPHPMHLINVTLSGKALMQLATEIRSQEVGLKEFPIVGMGFRGKFFGELVSQGFAWHVADQVTWLGKPIESSKRYTFVTVDHLLFIPFFPTIGQKAQIEMLFPEFIRTVIGAYLSDHYPCD